MVRIGGTLTRDSVNITNGRKFHDWKKKIKNFFTDYRLLKLR